MYESYYGFTGKPFQLNPDPSFYFGSRQHTRAMAYLEYGLHQNEGFIVVTGEIGAGKTTIVRNLLSKLDPQKVLAAQLVSTQLDADDTLRMVGAAFGLRMQGVNKSEMLLTLEAFLIASSQQGKRALLIVDEAQNLTQRAVEELRMLSNFQLGTHALLQSFLVGQPEFRQIMQSSQMQQLRQRVIAACHIGPLDSAESRGYIEHRLKCVGWDANPRLLPGAYLAIHQATEGIPRRINSVCDRLLLSGFLADKRVFDRKDVEQVAQEIREETSASGSDVSASSVVPRPAATVASSSEILPAAADTPAARGPGRLKAVTSGTLSIDASRSGLDAETTNEVSRLIATMQTSSVEERLTRLERRTDAMLALLQQLMDAVRSRPTPAVPTPGNNGPTTIRDGQT